MEISDYKNDRNYLFVVLKHIYRMNSLLCGAIWVCLKGLVIGWSWVKTNFKDQI